MATVTALAGNQRHGVSNWMVLVVAVSTKAKSHHRLLSSLSLMLSVYMVCYCCFAGTFTLCFQIKEMEWMVCMLYAGFYASSVLFSERSHSRLATCWGVLSVQYSAVALHIHQWD
jgi:hypothetical protein